MKASKRKDTLITTKTHINNIQIIPVDGFLNLPDDVGETIESPEFELCSRLWQLRIFPGGSLVAHKGFLSFYLASKSTVVSRASYKLIIKRQHGMTDETGEMTSPVVDEIFASTGVRKFEARGVHVDGWGWVTRRFKITVTI